jgi:hypothetical protein
MISGTTRATSSLANSACAISGGSDVALPIPRPNSNTPINNSWILVPAAASNAMDPAICTP